MREKNVNLSLVQSFTHKALSGRESALFQKYDRTALHFGSFIIP